jgi:regulator of sirC expression with transglutaminase-like and TPR domain
MSLLDPDPAARQRFSELVSRPDVDVDLAEASLLIACEEYPELDPGAYLDRLDALAETVRPRLRGGAATAVEAMNRLLFDEEGFRGNTKEYYDPRNSFLNDVLDRRTGIPISLSTVYIEVGRRAGLTLQGVGLPGHFIVRLSAGGSDVLVDPFYGGAVLTEADCQKRLDRIYGGKVKVQPQMLAPCDRKGILARTLRNLKAIYVKAEDHVRALRTVEMLIALNPRGIEELRDRGLLYAALDCYGLASDDLEAYLQAVPGAPEAEDLRGRIADMRKKATRLN